LLRLDIVAAIQFNVFAVALAAAFLVSRIPALTPTSGESVGLWQRTEDPAEEPTTLWFILAAAVLWGVARNAVTPTPFGIG
jgi:hypothetical protein